MKLERKQLISWIVLNSANQILYFNRKLTNEIFSGLIPSFTEGNWLILQITIIPQKYLECCSCWLFHVYRVKLTFTMILFLTFTSCKQFYLLVVVIVVTLGESSLPLPLSLLTKLFLQRPYFPTSASSSPSSVSPTRAFVCTHTYAIYVGIYLHSSLYKQLFTRGQLERPVPPFPLGEEGVLFPIFHSFIHPYLFLNWFSYSLMSALP